MNKRLIVAATSDLIPEAWRSEFLVVRAIGEEVCVVQPFLYTYALLAGVEFPTEGTIDYRARYCYETASDVIAALAQWDGTGDPPGPWVKEKLSERLGPGATQESPWT